MMVPFFAASHLEFIGDAYDQFAHVPYLVDLLCPFEAVQVNLPVDVLERLLASVDIGNADLVMCRISALSVHLDGSDLRVGKGVLAPVRSLKAEVSVREYPVEPLIPGGENKIPRGKPAQGLLDPWSRRPRKGRVAVLLKK